MRNIFRTAFLLALAIALIVLAGLILNAIGQTQKSRAVTKDLPGAQQPLYTEYKGVKLGMTPQEVRAKLGDPVLKDDEMDYFTFADNVTAQVFYDKARQVKSISVDYPGGTGAPESRAVVGTDLDARPDGSSYKVVRYEARGFWVSYNRTAGPGVIVTITIQTIP